MRTLFGEHDQMNNVLIFLSLLGSFVVICQWVVFFYVRRFIFGRYEPISRIVAYPVLILIGILNIVVSRLAIGSDYLPAESTLRQILSAGYFSFLGWILLVCLFLLLLGLINVLPLLKDWLGSSATSRNSEARVCNENGYVTRCRSSQSKKCEDADQGNTEKDVIDKETAAMPTETVQSRRTFLKLTTSSGLIVAAGLAGKGIAEGFSPAVQEEYNLFHTKLTAGEVTFIHVTDFHFGMFFGSDQLEDLVQRLNKMGGDALFLTGDLFHSPLTEVENAVPILRRLRARKFGNFAVLGNHDFYAGEWRSVESIRQSGLTLLRNEWRAFTVNGTDIHIGGIDDPMVNWVWGKSFPDFPKFMAKAPKDRGLRILLSHRPNVLPVAAEGDFDLVLAGHIHGGQVIIPFVGHDRGTSIAQAASEYTYGWYTQGDCRMYLNRGIGLTFIPWRLNCPPEIAVIHIRPADRIRITRVHSSSEVSCGRC